MKTYWRSDGTAPRIPDLGTRWRWAVSFTPLPLYPKEKAPRIHMRGGWVSPRAGLDTVVKRNFTAPVGYRTPNHPARSAAIYHWANPAQMKGKKKLREDTKRLHSTLTSDVSLTDRRWRLRVLGLSWLLSLVEEIYYAHQNVILIFHGKIPNLTFVNRDGSVRTVFITAYWHTFHCHVKIRLLCNIQHLNESHEVHFVA
jgi:hypothetical protein